MIIADAVIRSRLEEVKDVLRALCRPQSEELVIRFGEGPTAADRHETRVAVFREDHTRHPSTRNCPTPNTTFRAPAFSGMELWSRASLRDTPAVKGGAR